MKAILCFILGIGVGIEIFYFVKEYRNEKYIPAIMRAQKKDVLSSQAMVTLTPTPVITPTNTNPFYTESPTLTPTTTLTPTQIKLTSTPFAKTKYSVTPTKKPSLTPTKTISITPTSSQSIQSAITTIVSAAPTPTKVIIPAATSQEINSYFDRFAGQYGIDANVLRHIALCESGFNALAINGSYAGLYQFSTSAWSTYRTKIGESTNSDLRLNAEEAVQTAAYVISIGKSSIWPNCVP